MKKTLTIIATLSVLAGFTAAVEGYDGPKDQPHIMGGASSASATTGVGPNGTQYHVEVSETNTSGTITNDSVSLVEKSVNSVNFTGKIQAPTPCHTVDHEAERNGESMTVNITLQASDRVCTQQVVMKEYDGFAEAEGLKTVRVLHRGKQMAVFKTKPEKKPVDNHAKKKGFFSNLGRWLSGLF